MRYEEFEASLNAAGPPAGMTPVQRALWWDRRGDWARAHAEVDELETPEAMAVHAYLHRKEGVGWNADYWYSRAGRRFYRERFEEEWEALARALL